MEYNKMTLALEQYEVLRSFMSNLGFSWVKKNHAFRRGDLYVRVSTAAKMCNNPERWKVHSDLTHGVHMSIRVDGKTITASVREFNSAFSELKDSFDAIHISVGKRGNITLLDSKHNRMELKEMEGKVEFKKKIASWTLHAEGTCLYDNDDSSVYMIDDNSRYLSNIRSGGWLVVGSDVYHLR